MIALTLEEIEGELTDLANEVEYLDDYCDDYCDEGLSERLRKLARRIAVQIEADKLARAA